MKNIKVPSPERQLDTPTYEARKQTSASQLPSRERMVRMDGLL